MCDLTKRDFALYSFFLEPKTAYLKALLYKEKLYRKTVYKSFQNASLCSVASQLLQFTVCRGV